MLSDRNYAEYCGEQHEHHAYALKKPQSFTEYYHARERCKGRFKGIECGGCGRAHELDADKKKLQAHGITEQCFKEEYQPHEPIRRQAQPSRDKPDYEADDAGSSRDIGIGNGGIEAAV